MSEHMEQQVSRKSLVRRAALLVGAGSVGALAAPAVASAGTTETGFYVGNGGTIQVNSGLLGLHALWIVTVPEHGQSVEAFTTHTIQSSLGSAPRSSTAEGTTAWRSRAPHSLSPIRI